MIRKLKLDLHVHSYFSADSVADPEEIIAVAKRKGLNGIAITDHNTSECVDYFLQKGLMRSDGLPVDDFLILPGQEITTSEGHLLALGVTLPNNLKGITPQEAIQLIHSNGGLAVPPHPYDLFRAGIRENILEKLEFDALEVFNAATTFKCYNRRAFDYAKKRELPMTAASDAHHPEAVGTAYGTYETVDFSLTGILQAIKQVSELNQTYLTAREAFKKTWSNWIRLKRRPKPLVEA